MIGSTTGVWSSGFILVHEDESDLLLCKKDSLEVARYRRIYAGDRDLNLIHSSWEQSLRRAVDELPDIEFPPARNGNSMAVVQ
jgi:predicted proteasome-type protease